MSSDFDWKTAVSAIAPTIAGTFGTPLLGAGVALLCKELLGTASTDQATNEAALNTALQAGLTPEQKAAIATADSNLKLAMITADVSKTQIAADTEKSYLQDVMDARAHNANTVGVMRLGYLVNAASYLCVLIILYGCYAVLTTRGLFNGVDPGLAAAVGSVVGAVVQFVISNTLQANGFFFGSSPSARTTSSALASSVTGTVTAAAKQQAKK